MFRKQTRSDSNDIPLQDFQNYFQTLASDAHIREDLDVEEFLNSFSHNEENSTFQELDEPITQSEIKHAITRLKSNKACSTDCLLNEYFIECADMLLEPIHMIFNHILNTQKFPSIWAEGIIVPIFKKGDKNDPANIRSMYSQAKSCVRHFGSIFSNVMSGCCKGRSFPRYYIRYFLLILKRFSKLMLMLESRWNKYRYIY